MTPGPAPSGSVFLVNRSITRRVAFGKRLHQSCAHPATGGTRKLSVPGHVHSVPKSCAFLETFGLPGANPFLTRGTVGSSAKCLNCAFNSQREPPPPIRPKGSMSNPATG